MQKTIMKFCLTAMILACGASAFAASEPPPVAAEVKVSMIEEILRGSNEMFYCANGLTSDKEINDCLSQVLDINVQKDSDTAPFLAGMYFTALARFNASEPTAGIKNKMLSACLNRITEIEKGLGYSDKDLAGITQNTALLPVIEKMRANAQND